MTLQVTFQRARFTFRHLNQLVFEGKLSEPYWDIENLDTEVGYCVREGRDYHIGLTDTFENNWEFVGTLAHEMTHLYQYQVLKEEPNHGSTFVKFLDKFAAMDVCI